MTITTPYIQVEDLCLDFQSREILHQISFSLDCGELVGIWGLNASSKTTLIKALSGLIPSKSGTFTINNTVYEADKLPSSLSLGIFPILGEEQLLNNLSISDNLFLGMYQKTSSFPGCYNVHSTLEQTRLLLRKYDCHIDPESPISSLTSMQKYILLILHALIHNAKILLIDDCFSEFDANDGNFFVDFLKHLATEKIGIAIASQNLEHLLKVSDSIMTIRNGTLSEKRPSKIDLFQEAIIPDVLYPKIHINQGDIIYQCQNLTLSNTLKNITLHVREGELVGIIGASGSGRTTLARTICGDLRPDCSNTKVNHRSVQIRSTKEARKYGISLITCAISNNNIVPRMSIKDNILLGNFSKAAYRLFPSVISNKKQNYLIQNLLNNFGINESADHPICFLSSGTRRKVVLSRPVLSGSQLILMDEPSAGIDTTGRIQLYNIINQLLIARKGVLLFTSDVFEAINLCDRIYVLKNGSIVKEILPQNTSPEDLSQFIWEK